MIDALEPRQLLAVFSGTSGNDVIQITIQAGGAQSLISINGTSNLTADPSITINAGEGNDTFNVFRVRGGTTVIARGDGGNDTLTNPTSTSRDLDSIYDGTLTFEGGLGTDTVTADNSGDGDTTGYEMSLTGIQIEKNDFITLLSYNTIEHLNYVDNDAGNLISYLSMQGFTRNVGLTISGRGGNDTIFNTSEVNSTGGDWDQSIGTPGVIIDAGAGTDVLQLRNTDSSTNQYYFLSTSISGALSPGSGTGEVSHSGVETIDFAGGTHAELFSIRGKPNTTALRADAGDGNDTFVVGNGDIDSTGILLSNTTLLGGAGTDDIAFDDRLDNQSDGTTSNYTFGQFTFTKGSFGATYSAFETQQLEVANGTVAGLNTVPVVNLHVVSSEMTHTTIVGGANRSASVNIANGNLATVAGNVDVQLTGGASDALSVNNQSFTTPATYLLTQTALLLPKNIQYSGVSTFTIQGGSGGETFLMEGLPTGTTLVLGANDGNDSLTLGGGNVSANLLAGSFLSGGAGVDSLTIANQMDNTLATQTLLSDRFIDTFTHNYTLFDSVLLNEGPGGTALSVDSLAVRATVNGNSGDDNVTVGGGDIDLNIPASTPTAPALLIFGLGGNDSIRFNDFNDDVANSDSYVFQKTSGNDQFFRSDVGQRYVSWLDVDEITLDQSNAVHPSFFSGTFVRGIDTPLRVNGNGGIDTMQIEDAAIPVTIHTGLGDRDRLFVDDGDSLPATAVIAQDDDVDTLTIGTNGTLRIASNAVVAKTRLGGSPTFDIFGVLDMAGGTLLSRAGGPSVATIQTWLTRGHNGGAWNGTNANGTINSSLAAASILSDGVGHGLGLEISPTSVGSFVINPADSVIRYALDGDADLNATVNLDDFTRLAAGFGQPGAVWTRGDFSYDNSVNLDDFTSLAGNFGTVAMRQAFSNQPIDLAQDTALDRGNRRIFLEELS